MDNMLIKGFEDELAIARTILLDEGVWIHEEALAVLCNRTNLNNEWSRAVMNEAYVSLMEELTEEEIMTAVSYIDHTELLRKAGVVTPSVAVAYLSDQGIPPAKAWAAIVGAERAAGKNLSLLFSPNSQEL